MNAIEYWQTVGQQQEQDNAEIDDAILFAMDKQKSARKILVESGKDRYLLDMEIERQ